MTSAHQEVAPGVHRFADGVVNRYVIEEDGRLALVDTGWPRSWPGIEEDLGRLGRGPSDIAAILLTHGHADHMGGAARTKQASGAPVYVHREEAERVRGERRGSSSFALVPKLVPHLWRPTSTAFVLHATVRGFLTPTWVKVVTTFASDEQLDVPGRPRAVFTPGHTEGHTAFLLADRGVLLCGDALATRDPFTGAAGPRIIADALNSDPELARSSLSAVEETGATTVLPGHGDPWTGGAAEAVARARANDV